MNFRLLATLSFTVAAGLSVAVAQPADNASAGGPPSPSATAGAPGAASAGPQGSDNDHTELGDHMKKIGKAFKTLHKQITDSTQNESSLALVATMHENCEAALQLKPAKEADLPADQQADFQAKFEDGMKHFIGELDKLSALLKAGDNTGAAAELKELGSLEHKDHKEFRKPEKS